MDKIEWERVVEDLAPRLYRYFNGAEDYVQDTLFRLFQKVQAGAFDPSLGNIRMYAYGIARFVRLERRKFNNKIDQEVYLTAIPQVVSPDESIDENQRLRSLRSAMKQLTDTQQEILGFYIDNELTLNEIGVLMNLPVGTVKSHIHRAKEKLKELLNG